MRVSLRRFVLFGTICLSASWMSYTNAQDSYRYEEADPLTSVLTAPPQPVAEEELTPGDEEEENVDSPSDLYVADPTAKAPTDSPPIYAQPTGTPSAPPPSDEAKKKAAAAAKKKKEDLKKAVNGAYKGVFYDNNFAYINNPKYDECFVGDNLKQMKVGDCTTIDLGGQYRARYHGERNMRGLGVTGRDDDFLLHRTRLFMNAKHGDTLRFYGEFIDAESNYENFAPRNIEVNRADMLNLFVDWTFHEGCCGSLTARVGRQELLYGSQRLVSPLDWANTRRTFEGVNFLWRGEDWNIDTFAVEPVAVNPEQFDSAIDEQEFFGTWATYKGIKNQTVDLFGLQYNNSSAPQSFQFTTLGGRWLGSQEEWLWELEGGVQFGENTDNSDHSAGFFTVGGGHKWECHDWKPTLWGYYDWSNGDDSRGAANGFNHLFPLAHKYLGFMDLFGRSNIESPNVLLTFQPHKKLNVLVWYYYFFLQNGRDTPYNVNMSPFAPGSAPGSRDLGQELDLIFTYNINARMDMLFGYSHFFAGDYYKLTPGIPSRDDADFFYLQYQWNF